MMIETAEPHVLPANSNISPLVTIITPSYNQAQYLEETILSVLSQGYPNLEYMVIDGGSTDGSQEVIRRYSDRLAYWVSEKDQGQSQAINKGLARSRGSILSWLNSDDLLLPGVVRRIVETFTSNVDVDVVYGRVERIDQFGKPVLTPILPKDKVEFDKRFALMEGVVNQPGCFWRRGIMEKTGVLNESLHYGMDYEYWTRMLAAGAKFKRLDRPLAKFRLSPQSKTVGQTTKMAVEAIFIVNTFLSQPDLPQKLGLSPSRLRHQSKKGLGVINLQAFYGCLKDRKMLEGIRWLWRALTYDPFVLFHSQWLALTLAGLKRRIFK